MKVKESLKDRERTQIKTMDNRILSEVKGAGEGRRMLKPGKQKK